MHNVLPLFKILDLSIAHRSSNSACRALDSISFPFLPLARRSGMTDFFAVSPGDAPSFFWGEKRRIFLNIHSLTLPFQKMGIFECR
jgi:hypothetical protein